jgi:hypothetical protein
MLWAKLTIIIVTIMSAYALENISFLFPVDQKDKKWRLSTAVCRTVTWEDTSEMQGF